MEDNVLSQTASVFHAIFPKKNRKQHKLSNPIKKLLIFIPRAFGRFPKIEKKPGLESAIVMPTKKNNEQNFPVFVSRKIKGRSLERSTFSAIAGLIEILIVHPRVSFLSFRFCECCRTYVQVDYAIGNDLIALSLFFYFNARCRSS